MRKIQENESIKPYLEISKILKFGCQTIDKIPLIYKFNPNLKINRDQIMGLIKQSEIFTLPDQFNEFFSKDGWVCYGGLGHHTLEQSVNLALNNKHEDAKILLTNYIDETKIQLILKKCATRDHFKERLELLTLLKLDYLEQRYHACIPLLLALIDGLANDVSNHVGFFTDKLDLELFDSITSHSSGLPFLKIIMNNSRTKTTKIEINIPYRNGILHGRDLNFANKEVASKCWWVLDCLIEWADEKTLNKQTSKPKSVQNILEEYQETQEYSTRIKNWKKRPIHSEEYWKIQSLNSLEQGSPEYTLFSFLNAWKAEQWGKMTPLLLHNIGKHVGKATNEIKKDYQRINLTNFSIVHSEDQNPSTTKIRTCIEYTKLESKQTLHLDISLNYANSVSSRPELRNEKSGQWYILQLSLREILFS